eukprot:3817466-Prymnesium_polylepis.1
MSARRSLPNSHSTPPSASRVAILPPRTGEEGCRPHSECIVRPFHTHTPPSASRVAFLPPHVPEKKVADPWLQTAGTPSASYGNRRREEEKGNPWANTGLVVQPPLGDSCQASVEP